MQPGTLVRGRFRVLSLAGEGGMGEVYAALDEHSGARVALKVVRGPQGPAAQRFLREASLLAELPHPAIVRYVAHGEAATGELFLVMEWLEGEDLEARLARAPLTPRESIALARRVAQALAAVHARGVTHRDVKPSNIHLGEGAVGNAKLLDFGIARRAQASQALTGTGGVLGTARYMAPEQVQGRPDVGPRADIFALGAVLYECLAGRPSFGGDDAMAVLAKVLLEAPPPLVEARADLPERLVELVRRMLAKRPEDRPADMGAVAAELAQLEDTVEGLAAPASLAPRAEVGSSGRERRLVCVLLAPGHPAGPNPLADTLVPESLDPAHVRLEAVAAEYGGRVARLADGSVVAVMSGGGVATDQAARAARCALALRPVHTGGPIALAMGWAEFDALPTGGVIDRAAELMRAARESGDEDAPTTVRVDEVAAALLDVHFLVVRDAQGFELRSERDLGSGPRPLLGKATACVGRDRELGVLSGLYEEVEAEAVARAVVVTAPAGTGKSRVRYEFVRRLGQREEPVRAWVARADAMRAGAPLDLLAKLVRSAASIREGEPGPVAAEKLEGRVRLVAPDDVVELTEFLGEMIGVERPGPATPRFAAARADARLMGENLQRAFTRWLAAEATAHPVVLVLEDLHWGDPLTVKFLDHALRELREARLLVAAFARPEVHDAFPGLWKARGVQEIHLAALSARACERLVRLVLGSGVSDEQLERMVRQSDGNALHLEEIIRAIAEDGPEGRALPASVVAMVQSRLDALEPLLRRALRSASVLGETFWAGGVAALVEPSEAAGIPGALEALVEREVVLRRGDSRIAGQQEYAFPHALLRDAAYATLADADRRLGHARAAAWLEGVGETEALVLAEHAERGGLEHEATRHHAAAARQAVRKNDFTAALVCADRATRGEVEPALLLEVALTRVQALTALGRWSDARVEVERARALVAPSDHERRYLLLMDRLMCDIFRQDTVGIRECADETEALAAAAGTEVTLAGARVARALSEHAEHRPDRCAELLRGATLSGGKLAVPLAFASIAFYHVGFYEEGIRAGRIGSATAAAVGDSLTRSLALANLGATLGGAGRYREAHEATAEACEVAQRAGLTTFEARAHALACGHHHELFDHDAAEELAERARYLGRAIELASPRVSAALDLAFIQLGRGDAAAAEGVLAAVAEHIEASTGFHGWLFRTRLRVLEAAIALTRGEWAAGLTLSERALEQARSVRRAKYAGYAQLLAARALHGLGRGEEAGPRLDDARDLAERLGDPALALRADLTRLAFGHDAAVATRARGTLERILAELPTDRATRLRGAAEVRVLGA